MPLSASKTFLFPLLLVLYEVAAYLSNDMYLPALPQMMQQLHTSAALTQATLTTWFMGMASMHLILGAISDRFGRRPVLLLGGIIFVGASMVCATAQSIAILLVARFCQGAAVCSLIIAGYATIHELLVQQQAIKTLAWMGSITILAPAFGPLLGSLVLAFYDWRTIFWIPALWASIILLALGKWMPESLDKTQVVPLNLAKLLRIYQQILSNKLYTCHMLACCLIFGGFIAWITLGPFLLLQHFHRTVIYFGIIQALVFISFIVGMQSIRFFIDSIPARKLIKGGLILALCASTLNLIFSSMLADNLFIFTFCLMLFAYASGLISAPLNRLAIEAAHSQPMGARVAIYSSGMSIFAILGSSLATIFYNKQAISITAILFLVSCLAYWVNSLNRIKLIS